ncbi:MAG: RNA polymerase sigma-70 factor [Ginsengibacter sp.]
MPDQSLYDEKALLAEIAAGNEIAFRKLFDFYKKRFYAVALKMTGSDEIAKDIVQDTFMNIWDKRESLSDVDNPSAYFFTAVYRRIYHHYRKVAQEKKLLEEASSINDSVNTTEEMVLAHESSELIFEAVEKLPPQQKLVFRLSRQEGLNREEVASQLNISPNTVRNHLAEAIKFIRTFLRNSTATFLIIFWFLKK